MYLSEISKLIGIDIQSVTSGFSLLNLNNCGLYVQGKIKIKSYNTCKIALAAGKQNIIIIGQNMRIKRLSSSDIAILGTIDAVTGKEVVFEQI